MVKSSCVRIELGEIEQQMMRHPAVAQAVAIIDSHASSRQQLFAYARLNVGKHIDVQELKTTLQQSLPSYMLPNDIFVVQQLPLTSNGKVDRAALVLPQTTATSAVEAMTLPQQQLRTIWSSVLALPEQQINLHSNFFELGGDSIASIQIAAQAQQQGLALTTKQVFRYPVLQQLAQVAASQIAVTRKPVHHDAAITLTPIQCWLLNRDYQSQYYFNHDFRVELPAAVLTEQIKPRLQQWLRHHSALRQQFYWQGHWQVRRFTYQQAKSLLLFEVFDYQNFSTAKQQQLIAKQAQTMHRSLVLGEDLLFRGALFQLAPQRRQLVMVAHHLIIDAVSWRLLLAELVNGDQVLRDDEFPQWQQRLRRYAQSNPVARDCNYWWTMLRHVQPHNNALLPTKLPITNTYNDCTTHHHQIDRALSTALFEVVKIDHALTVSDLLLSALVIASAQPGTNSAELLVTMEHHGRASIDDHYDYADCVGWCTALYPLQLVASDVTDMEATLASVQQQLAAVPNHGMSFSLLKYLHPDSRIRSQLSLLPRPLIAFNYLGNLDAGELSLQAHPKLTRKHWLEIDSFVQDGQLHCYWSYNHRAQSQRAITRLTQRYQRALQQLVNNLQQRLTSDDIVSRYPLTHLQQGLLFHRLYRPDTDQYFVQLIMTINSQLNTEAFVAAWQQVVNHYEILRTGFDYQSADQPLQFVFGSVDLPVKQLDWQQLSAAEQRRRLRELLTVDRQIRFAMDQPPLCRLYLLQFADDHYDCVFSHHHILVGGWSLALIVNAVFCCYQAITTGQSQRLPRARSYQDYIQWLQQQDYQAANQYWRQLLHGFDQPTQLTIQRSSPDEQAYQDQPHRQQLLRLKQPQVKQLQQLSRQHQLTLNSIMQGLWALVLARFSGDSDIVFGVTSSGRPAGLSDIEAMVGLIITTLPLRATLDEQHNFIQFCQQLQRQAIATREYEYSRLVDIHRDCGLAGGQELFEILYLFENYPHHYQDIDVVKLHKISIRERTHYKLTLTITAWPKFECRFIYDPRFFSRAAIQQLRLALNSLLQQVLVEPLTNICQLHGLTPQQWQQTVYDVNDTAVQLPAASLGELFERQVQRSPHAIAISDRYQGLTYEQLNQRSNQLAHYFLSQGLQAEQLIAVSMSRQIDYVVVLLAVIKAGAAYLPLDPGLPESRLTLMLDDAQPWLIITDDNRIALLAQDNHILLETLLQRAAPQPIVNPAVKVPSSQWLYLYYTSGSTGIPKGVQIEQQAMVNFIVAMKRLLRVNQEDKFLATTPFTFDICHLEWLLPLIVGAEVCLADADLVMDASSLIAAIEQQHITRMQATPATWRILVNAGWNNPRNITIIVGGEPLSRYLARRLLQRGDGFWNMYGPTETTVWSTAQYINRLPRDRQTMPIGTPIMNTQVYVLDPQGNLLPPGAVGELFIAGAGVARGYWQRPELTRQQFLTLNIDGKPQRMYRSGDLVCWNAQGTLDYVGRCDDQVKVHGYRIELAEIEAYLMRHPAVSHCVVICRGERTSERRLIAYLVIKDSNNVYAIDEWQDFLKQYLPHYMIPPDFVLLPTLPLLSNHKINKQALPAPLQQSTQPVAKPWHAETELERRLQQLWLEVLKKPSTCVTLDDEFFVMGGDSISAVTLIGKIQEYWQLKLPLKILFSHATFGELLSVLQRRITRRERYQDVELRQLSQIPSPLIPLRDAGEDIPIFLIHPIGGTVFCYLPLLQHINNQHPVYAIQDPGLETHALLFETLTELAGYYLSLIKSVRPEGPYVVAGASFGGNVAMEIARQLIDAGNSNVAIASLDGWGIYPAKVNNDQQWFESNMQRQHHMLSKLFDAKVDVPELLLELHWQRQQLLAKHQLSVRPYQLALFKSDIVSPVLRSIDSRYNHWEQFTSAPVTLYKVPGDHETLLQEPHVTELGDKFNQWLRIVKNHYKGSH